MTRDIKDLFPIVAKKAQDFQALAKNNGYDFVITCTYRSKEEQDALYAQGRTNAGAIVTNAKGGQSYHNWRCAFDIVPLVNGKTVWNDDALWAKLGQLGTSVGLEWGGSWTGFKDMPHFQYTCGYTFQDFLENKVDVKKFELPVPNKASEYLADLNGRFNAKNYKGAKDSCSLLFTELTKLI